MIRTFLLKCRILPPIDYKSMESSDILSAFQQGFAVPGIIEDPLDSSRRITCCTGGSYTPVKTDVRVDCKGDIVSERRIVLFSSQLVTMVIAAFDARTC